MSEPLIIDGVNLKTASFEEILALPGIGTKKMERYMKAVERLEEYKKWIGPLIVDGVEVHRSDLNKYGNLVSTFRSWPAYDPDDPNLYSGSYIERTRQARDRFTEDRAKGIITDEMLARKVLEIKAQKAQTEEDEASKIVVDSTGVDPQMMEQMAARIADHYERFLTEVNAPSAADQKDVLHAATLQVNREILSEAYSSLTSKITIPGYRPSQNDLRMIQLIGDQMNKASADVERIMKNFRVKGDGAGPAQTITDTLTKGKEVMETFFRPMTCPGCGIRYGIVGLFVPVENFPKISFNCIRTHPDGKKCNGVIEVDMLQHLKEQKVVKFTQASHFDPSVMIKQLSKE